jgi:hypothetical protein
MMATKTKVPAMTREVVFSRIFSESGEDYKDCLDKDSAEGVHSFGAGEGGVNSAWTTIPHQSQLCICQQLYLDENNSKKVLHLLSIGLKDSDCCVY